MDVTPPNDAEKLKAQNAELASKWLKEIGRRRSNEKKWRERGKEGRRAVPGRARERLG
jgi:hypothetical protein